MHKLLDVALALQIGPLGVVPWATATAVAIAVEPDGAANTKYPWFKDGRRWLIRFSSGPVGCRNPGSGRDCHEVHILLRSRKLPSALPLNSGQWIAVCSSDHLV